MPYANKMNGESFYINELFSKTTEKPAVAQDYKNTWLVISKYSSDFPFVTKSTTDFNVYDPADAVLFPLYIYEANDQLPAEPGRKRVINLNTEIVKNISEKTGLAFIPEKEIPLEGEVCFANSQEVRPEFRLTYSPIDILDYIYAILYSPAYREKHHRLLETDFFEIPYPADSTAFWQYAKWGGDLRQIHLLECPAVENRITQYPVDGDNKVEKIAYLDGKVFINATQYFNDVPTVAWEFYMGNYQPAQKWLGERKGRALEKDEIKHFQKIIVALAETDRIMKEIGKIKEES